MIYLVVPSLAGPNGNNEDTPQRLSFCALAATAPGA